MKSIINGNMKTIINGRDFAKAMKFGIKFIGKITDYWSIRSEGDWVIFTFLNTHTVMEAEYKVPAKGDIIDETIYLSSFKEFYKVAKTIKKEDAVINWEIEFENNKEDKITASINGFKLNVDSCKTVTGFPMDIDNGETSVNKGAEIKNALSRVSYCVSTDETRYFMTGVYFGDERMVATDGRRLAFIPFKSGLKKGYIVNGNILTSVLEGCDDDEDITITFSKDKKSMMITGNKVKAVILTIKGQFPDYKRVVPEFDKDVELTKIEIDREFLLEEIEKAKPFVEKRVNEIIFARNRIVVHSEIGDYESDELPYNFPNFGVNYDYMHDMLAVQFDGCDKIDGLFHSPFGNERTGDGRFICMKAITFKNGDSESVIMPMNISSEDAGVNTAGSSVGENADYYSKHNAGVPIVVVFNGEIISVTYDSASIDKSIRAGLVGSCNDVCVCTPNDYLIEKIVNKKLLSSKQVHNLNKIIYINAMFVTEEKSVVNE